jgi:hypothetical protein
MERNEVDPQGVELAQGVHQLPKAPGESVIAIDQHGVKLASLGVGEEAIQGWAGFLAARSGVCELFGNLPLAALSAKS